MTYPSPSDNPGGSEYNAPSGSWEEAALRQARVVITMDRTAVSALVRPPLPQIGQPPMYRAQAQTLGRVLGAVGRSNADNRTFLSGTSAGYSGSERNDWGQPF